MNGKYLIAAAALLVVGCTGQPKADDPLADSGRTLRTENLLVNLLLTGDSAVYLVGHENSTVGGVGWVADYGSDSTVHQRSDVKSVCNDLPAVLGFDLTGIEAGREQNADGVPFSRIRQEVFAHYGRGGMVTLSWTVGSADSLTDGEVEKTDGEVKNTNGGVEKTDGEIDRVAVFLRSLETPYGVRVPVLFRLRGSFTKTLWQRVAQRFTEQEVTNALLVYAPAWEPSPGEAGAVAEASDESRYLEQYPGDDIIDVLGIDSYCLGDENDTVAYSAFMAHMDASLGMLSGIAKKHGKACALTETGYGGVRYDTWWTTVLQPVLDRHPVAYVLLWHNDHRQPTRCHAPYPGQRSASDFVRFYNAPQTLFLHDINGLYRQR
jgi:mannan endo-1,4-beta-mannosidase